MITISDMGFEDTTGGVGRINNYLSCGSTYDKNQINLLGMLLLVKSTLTLSKWRR